MPIISEIEAKTMSENLIFDYCKWCFENGWHYAHSENDLKCHRCALFHRGIFKNI